MTRANLLEGWGSAVVDRWIAFAIRRPKHMLALWLVLLIGASAGLKWLRVETSGESILDKTDEAWAFYRKSVDLFGNDEVIVAAIEAPNPYDRSTLQLISDVSHTLAAAAGVRRVDSISTFPIVDVSEDGSVRLDPAIDPGAPIDATAAEYAGVRSRADRIGNRIVVSDDGRVFAVNVWPEAGVEERYDQLVETIRGAVATPGAWVSGVPVFRTEINLRTERELAIFVPLTALVMILLLFAAFQRARGVVVPLAVSGVSVLILFGLMGWFGVPISAPTMILPPILLAVGCAYAMHLLTEVDGIEDQAELEEAVRHVSGPIGLSGVTTAIGFASTAIVSIEAVQRVGVLGAAGAVISCAATTGLGVAIVALWRTKSRRNPLLVWLRAFTTNSLLGAIKSHAGIVVLAWVSLLSIGIAAANRLHVESDVVVWFPRGTEVRDAYESIKVRLSGISPLNVVIRSSDGGSVSRPEVLNAIDGLGSYLGSLPEVGKVVSVADPVRQLHAGLVGDTRAGLPQSVDAIEQYLLLLEGTERLSDLITRDRTAANVLLRVNDNGSRSLLAVAEKANEWWRTHGPKGTEAVATGSMFEYARAEEAISAGQIQGLGFDVAIIASILVVALRSFRLAMLALIPNVLPIGLMFGFMGATGIPLDLGTVFVTNLAVGVAIDETIHLVTAYARAKAGGVDAEEALRTSMDRVVPALVLTTVVIAFGFLVLSVSEFRFTRNLGLLTAGVMVLCVASNATLLPALLLKFGGGQKRGSRKRVRSPEGATPGAFVI
jgi:predicted RND superfamily exporter protein